MPQRQLCLCSVPVQGLTGHLLVQHSLMTRRWSACYHSWMGWPNQSECSWGPAHPARRVECVVDSAPCGPLQPHPHARPARLWHWLVICARSWAVNYQRWVYVADCLLLNPTVPPFLILMCLFIVCSIVWSTAAWAKGFVLRCAPNSPPKRAWWAPGWVVGRFTISPVGARVPGVVDPVICKEPRKHVSCASFVELPIALLCCSNES